MAGKSWKIPLRMRREIAEPTGYPVIPIPYNDGTIITTDDGYEIMNETPPPQYSYTEIKALEKRLSSKIQRLRKTNATPETG